jgi:nucleotidyltransferase substrate binding protein (TIGR01987 family)
MTAKIDLAFKLLGDALERLEEAVSEPIDAKRMNVDSTIQRFEFCIELFWKALKRILENEEVQTSSPKDVMQKAYKYNLINDEEIWLEMLHQRNQTSHTYQLELADKIYTEIKKTYCLAMLETYKDLSKKHIKEQQSAQ